ncbi:MAG: long-chain fatty acid--CoA ligase [Labilithrix sp.]
MDLTPFLELKIAPRAVFDALDERKDKVRFMVPSKNADGTPGEWQKVTFGQFAEQIRELALFLGTILKAGDRAAIYAPNRVEWASASLAIQAAAGVMVPVYPASTPEQLSYVIEHSDAKVLFVDTPALVTRVLQAHASLGHLERIVLLDDGIDVARILEKVPAGVELAKKFIDVTAARAMGAAQHAKDPALFTRTMHGVSLKQPGVMLYTSGTSGNPKGVPLTHENVAHNGQDWVKTLEPLLDYGQTDILWLPMSHIFGFGEMCIGNSLAWTTYLSDPVSCITQLPVLKPQVFFSVPSHWEKLAISAMHEPTPEARLARFKEVTGGDLKFCLSGGAGLKREVKDFFFSCGVTIIEGYGLTETSPTLTMNRPDSFRFDSVGKPFPSVELKLAEDGEILAKGPNVFGGYHKDPEATKACFTDDGWFMTGDVGRWTDDGFLQIIDRKKDILVTAGGKNVPPANIEMRFRDDPVIAHVVVYGEAKKFLVAGVWLNEAVAPKDEAARQAMVQDKIDAANKQLASYESIKKFAIITDPLTVEAELLTPSLKIRRKKIYERFKDTFEALYAAPKTSESTARA